MRRLVLATSLIVAMLPTSRAAWAQQTEDGTITVEQPKPVLRGGRLQLTPSFGVTVSDPLIRQYAAGGSLAYNVNERWFVSGTYEWFDFGTALGGETSAYEDVIAVTGAIPEVATVRWNSQLEAGYVPVFGKFVMFDSWILYYDMYATVGAGAIQTSGDAHASFGFSAGGHIYLNRWLSLVFTFRDRFSFEESPSGNSSLLQTATVGAGLSMFIPFDFEYARGDK